MVDPVGKANRVIFSASELLGRDCLGRVRGALDRIEEPAPQADRVRLPAVQPMTRFGILPNGVELCGRGVFEPVEKAAVCLETVFGRV